MNRKAKTALKVLGVLYLLAVGAFLYTLPYGRYVRTRPELRVVELTLPTPEGFEHAGGQQAYLAARRAFLDAGYLLRVPAADVHAGQRIDAEALDRLLAEGVSTVSLYDPVFIRRFSAQDLKAAEDIKTPDGEVLIPVSSSFTVENLTAVARIYDDQPDDRYEEIFVVGSGSIAGIDITLAFAGLNFLILAVLLYGLLWEPITKTLDERAKMIREDIETARVQRDQAEELKTEADDKLKEIRQNAHALVEEGRIEGEKERARLLDEAREESRRLLERTQRMMEAEKAQMRMRLLSEIGGLSSELASSILKREVTPSDHQVLVDEFIGGLKGEPGDA